MLIPLRHENMEGRRWPVVTFALIAINVLVFLGTHWTMEAQSPERTEVRTHLILLAATHPELNMPDDVDQFITEVQRKIPPELWKQIANPKRKSEDAWDAHIRTVTDRGRTPGRDGFAGATFRRTGKNLYSRQLRVCSRASRDHSPS